MSVLHGYEETLPEDRRHLLHQFTPIDAARKVVGVGSVGTRCFVVLLLGRDGDDPFFLQVKEANASVLEKYLGPSKFDTPGRRVVAGQQITQATPDPFLGWFDIDDPNGNSLHFYVRQLYDGKASADVSNVRRPAAARVLDDLRLDACTRAREVGKPLRHRELSREVRCL